MGTNTWGAKHTTSIISQILRKPAELRALAWAEASPRLLGIAAQANLVGLIGTALQLLGEGLYNYFNLDALQKWLQASAWGTANLQRNLPEDWSALATVVQQPTCELIREGKRTYLQLDCPASAHGKWTAASCNCWPISKPATVPIPGPYNQQLPPRRWQEYSAAWAAVALGVSQEDEALTLQLPIPDVLQTSDFALALSIGYQLEAERDLIHRTCFVLRDLRIATERGVRLPAQGRFTLDPVESLPTGSTKPRTGYSPATKWRRSMISQLFKRKNKPETPEPAPDIRSQRPSAGELRVKGLNETLFLAPLPVYTGQAQVSRRNFSAMNETYLELGGSNRGMVEQGKILAIGIWMVCVHSLYRSQLCHHLWSAFLSRKLQRPHCRISLMLSSVFQLCVLFILPIGGFIYGMLSNVRTLAKSYPVRFNRQRREVCYIDDTTHRVLIVPWESVVAWVARSQGVTSYGAMRDYTFGMGLEDEEHDTVQFILSAQPSDAHALGMWTSIRNYMEDGELVDTPNPMLAILGITLSEDELKPYEGLHTFEIERLDARLMGDLR